MLLAWILLFSSVLSPENLIEEANANAQKGAHATDYQERKVALNQALSLYSQAEKQLSLPPANLNRTIGDLYQLLNEYPMAVLYYTRAVKDHPADSETIARLHELQQKLGVPPYSPSQPSMYPNRWILGLIILSFVCCSFALWRPKKAIFALAAGSTFLLILFLSHFLFVYYTTPIEAIVIEASGLYRLPDHEASLLTPHPIQAGSQVRILQETGGGEWLKIVNAEGLVGYIPTTKARPIQ